jgi:transglutaminase-like putative cysteine protease
MRLHIAHRTVYRYDPPAAGAIQTLRLTPRNHEGQYVTRWRIDVSADTRLAAHEDAFGNITHVFTVDGPLPELSIDVEGEVETQNNNGVVRGSLERFPPSLFLRDTALTEADPAICAFAQAVRAAHGGEVLAELHGLLQSLHDEFAYDADTAAKPVSAAEAFARKSGVCRDFTHLFLSASHSLGIPARYVAGYFRDPDAKTDHESGHAWAEAFIPDLGWVGFDPANGVCPTDQHVRVAIGLDSLGAAPVRGIRSGTGAEQLEIAIRVDQ